jgi:hypothetical protein
MTVLLHGVAHGDVQYLFLRCASPIRDLAISGSPNTKRDPNSLKNRLPKISRPEPAVESKGPAFRMSLRLC